MGCDIHTVIEVKGRNGRWGVRDGEHRYSGLIEGKLSYKDYLKSRPDYINVLSRRSYTMFSVLADVRNDCIAPLFSGRGVPSDMSAGSRKIVSEDNVDLHSHTYFTLRELMETDWDAVAWSDVEVYLLADEYSKWKKSGKLPPGVYDKSHYGNVVTDKLPPGVYDKSHYGNVVTEAEMILLLMSTPVKSLTRKGLRRDFGPKVGVTVSFTYRHLVPEVINIIPSLQKLGAPDKVRVIIAFDN